MYPAANRRGAEAYVRAFGSKRNRSSSGNANVLLQPNCTVVAKNLIARYPFMKDTGEKVSGYVSVVYVMCWSMLLTVNNI